MSIEQQTASALKWTGLAKLVSQVVSWSATLIVLRLLAPEDYGLMATVAVIITVLAGVAELGLGASVVQSARMSRDDLAAVSGVVILFNIAIGVLVVACAPLIAWFYNEPRLTLLIQVASLSFLFNAVSTIPQSLAYREMAFKWLAAVDVSAVVASGALTLFLAWQGYGVWALILGMQVQNAVRAAMLLRMRQPRPAFHFRGVSRHLAFGGATTACRFVVQLVYQADILIAGRVLSPQALGVYSVSLHLATLPMQKIMSIVNQVAFPAVARIQHDAERLRMRMLQASRILTTFSIAALWGMSSVAPELVNLVLGPQWKGAVLPLQVVCVVVPVRMLNMVFMTASLAVGNVRVNLHATIVSALILPIAFLVGSMYGGVNGLAWAWGIAIPLVAVAHMKRMLESVSITIPEFLRELRWPALAGCTMYAAVSGIRQLMEGLPGYATLPVLVAAGAAAYIGALRLLDKGSLGELRRMAVALRS